MVSTTWGWSIEGEAPWVVLLTHPPATPPWDMPLDCPQEAAQGGVAICFYRLFEPLSRMCPRMALGGSLWGSTFLR